MSAARADRHGPVLAIRVPRLIAKTLNEMAEQFGGYGPAIEAMSTEQQLPAGWFRRYTGDVPGPHDTRISFRLTTSARRALRSWGGQRPLSKIIRHLVFYTCTDGHNASSAPRQDDHSRAALNSRPAPSTVAESPASRPPSPQSQSAGGAFHHLPPAPVGLSYVCQIPGCRFATGSGVVVRCAAHVKWIPAAFEHLPALPTDYQYICQVPSCRFTSGDGVSIGTVRVPAWCYQHDMRLGRT